MHLFYKCFFIYLTTFLIELSTQSPILESLVKFNSSLTNFNRTNDVFFNKEKSVFNIKTETSVGSDNRVYKPSILMLSRPIMSLKSSQDFHSNDMNFDHVAKLKKRQLAKPGRITYFLDESKMQAHADPIYEHVDEAKVSEESFFTTLLRKISGTFYFIFNKIKETLKAFFS